LVATAVRSREHVIRLDANFLAIVVREHVPFSVAAIIGDRNQPSVRDV
jgi:hypothetical protein